MLFKSSSALAFLALASQVVAEPANTVVYKMSVRELFGVDRRASDGYSPSTSVCSLGATCAEACGAGFATCTSTDDAIHCYDPANAQICCPGGSGNSCDAGYYCTGDASGETVCCPESQSLDECAKSNSVNGTLTLDVASSTSTSMSSTSTSSSSTLSSSSSTSSSAVLTTSSSVAPNTTTSFSSSSTVAKTTSHSFANFKANSTSVGTWGATFTTTSCSTTGAATTSAAEATAAVAASTNNFTTTAAPSATSGISTSAGELLKPAGFAAGLLAAGFALLL